MKRKSKRRQYFPRKKSTQTPWKIEPLKEVDSLEEIARESLSCSICMDYLSVPQTTPCGHVFCYLCIYKWLERDSICPQCRKAVDVAPYPVFLLLNQVDQALLKYPDPTTKLRIGNELNYYKSFTDPWAELYSSNMFFGENMYSSSSDDEEPAIFGTSTGLNNWLSSETSSADSNSNSDSDGNSSDHNIQNRTYSPIIIYQNRENYDEPDDCSSSSNDGFEFVFQDDTAYNSHADIPEQSEPQVVQEAEEQEPRRTGDVMLGRLVDQLQEVHLSSVNHESTYVKHLKELYPELSNVDQQYPFGNLLSEFHSSDMNVLNLETAITTESMPYPKTFNYRMHPKNIAILKKANISYVSLANNHILDFGKKGLLDTIELLAKSDIAFAGVGKSKSEAIFPSYKYIKGIKFAFLSASDHPKPWAAFPEFNYQNLEKLDYFILSNAVKVAKEKADFVIFSFHWGPNYQWFPDANIRRTARLLIDLGVDLIHGHSSHHIQGIEIYKGKPIFYGMGDFVDDYAVDQNYRNDLSFLYQAEYNISELNDLVNIQDSEKNSTGWGVSGFSYIPGSFNSKKTLQLSKLTLIPTRISLMQVNRISEECNDLTWLYKNMSRLCFDLGTTVQLDRDPRGNPIFNVSKTPDIKR